MTDLSRYRRSFSRLPDGVVEAEVNAETHDVTLVGVRHGKVSRVDQSEQTVLFLRVSGDRTGYVYTQDLQEEPADLIRIAYENGRHSEKEERDRIHRGAQAVHADYGYVPAERDVDLLGDCAAEVEHAIRGGSDAVSDVHVTLRAETTGMQTVNSHGLDVQNIKPLYIMSASFHSAVGSSLFAGAYNRTARALEAFRKEEFATRALEILQSQSDPSPFQSGTYRAILHRQAVYNIMSTAWQFFSAHRYLEGSNALAGKLGTTVAAGCLSIKDYPVHEESGFDYSCDCEGTRGEPVTLVDHGRFAGLMHNLSTSHDLGKDSTGNAGRRPLLYGNIATDIVVTPRNVCIEPGDSTFDSMIARMGDGVIITTTFDVFHSINIASGDFSIPCKATVVRGGKKVSNARSLSISGNLKDLFMDIEEVGSDFYIGTMLALDHYGIGACSLRVKRLQVSGE